MKLSILTMVTKPDERQELWRQALTNYCELADEVIVVDGTIDGPVLEFPDPKVRFVSLPWPEDWNYVEFPRHLNFGKKHCTGDWILLLMIDQMVSRKEHKKLRNFLENVSEDIDLVKMNKLNFIAEMMYAPKGSQGVVFRNKPYIGFGHIMDFPEGDLCIPMRVMDWTPAGTEVPVGIKMQTANSGCYFWNFNYTFRTKEVARSSFWRNARAFRKYFKSDILGHDEESSWEAFLEMMHKKFALCNHTARLDELPESIQEAIKNLKPEQLGYNFWGE